MTEYQDLLFTVGFIVVGLIAGIIWSYLEMR